MKIATSQVTKHLLTELDALDPVTVICEDIAPRKGKIVIECYGQSWSAYWGGMGDRTIAEFFCSCDEHYIANKISSIRSQVYDGDKIQKEAEVKGVDCWRDDPWNDYEFMAQMYGSDPHEWDLPMKANPDYEYLCRIINAVQAGLKEVMDKQKKAAA